jgi:single-strand DNA-binding protein
VAILARFKRQSKTKGKNMLNKVQIIGHVGKDVEMRYSASGDAMATFSLATTEKYKDKATGNQVENTEWHSITAFRRLAEVIGEYVKKGDLLYVEGQLQTRKYQDKKTGQDRYSTSIVAAQMKMLGNKSSPSQSAQPSNYSRGASAKPNANQADHDGLADMEDDIPF